ncbi:MAG: hypothetical protein LBS09_03425 [Bacteroidales bacterium]|jgi:hypothetical protein|nr:hypothetical protein [Bacteroidales bacterium]
MNRPLYVLFVLCAVHQVLTAQPPDYNFRFSARVVANDSTETSLRDCHVINTTQGLGTISNEFGDFTITANRGDSIRFSILGYERLTIAVADSMYANNRIIRLHPATYMLSDVEVGRFSTYDRFKRDFMDTQTASSPLMTIDPISKFEIAPKLLPGQGGINIPTLLAMLDHPITTLYNVFSKEGKQMRYYQSIVTGTADFIIIGKKFNGDIVKQLTGLENDELVRFMSDCFFTKEYLLYMPQEEINRAIVRKYNEWKTARAKSP